MQGATCDGGIGNLGSVASGSGSARVGPVAEAQVTLLRPLACPDSVSISIIKGILLL